MVFLKKCTLFLLSFELIFFLFIGEKIAFASYSFEETRLKIIDTLTAKQVPKKQVRFAILYQSKNQERIKKQVNLIQVKKNYAYEMLKTFQVTDPVITQEIFSLNKLKFSELKNDQNVINQFSDRSGSTHLILVQLEITNNVLHVKSELVSRNKEVLTTVTQLFTPQKIEQTSTSHNNNQTQTTQQIVTPQKASPPRVIFKSSQNDAWMFFAPTALLIPRTQAVEGTIWLKNLADSDVLPKNFRYQARYSIYEFGLQTYGTESGGHHSSYSTLSFQPINEEVLPFFLKLGVRGRLYWEETNLELKSDDQETEDKNDERNNVSFFASISIKIKSVGLLLNTYLDNQTFSMGAKFLLTSNLKLVADGIYYYYPDAPVKGDFAGGLEVHSKFSMISILYQHETEQALLRLQFNW